MKRNWIFPGTPGHNEAPGNTSAASLAGSEPLETSAATTPDNPLNTDEETNGSSGSAGGDAQAFSASPVSSEEAAIDPQDYAGNAPSYGAHLSKTGLQAAQGSGAPATTTANSESELPETNQINSQALPASGVNEVGVMRYGKFNEAAAVENNPAAAATEMTDAEAMTLLLGGAATASGTGSSTWGDVQLKIADYGPLTIGFGHSMFASEGEHADSFTFYDVSGADVVHSYEYSSGHQSQFPAMGNNVSYSMSYVVAIDFEDDAFASMYNAQNGSALFDSWTSLAGSNGSGSGSAVVEGNSAELSFQAGAAESSSSDPLLVSAGTQSIDDFGSFAYAAAQAAYSDLSISGEAYGFDTHISANGSLFELGDQFSSISADVIGVA